jgi:hypothetical protein
MPTKNFLSFETKKSLQQVVKEHEHPDIRQRAWIFLLLNNGNTQAQTAELIGCSLTILRTVFKEGYDRFCSREVKKVSAI